MSFTTYTKLKTKYKQTSYIYTNRTPNNITSPSHCKLTEALGQMKEETKRKKKKNNPQMKIIPALPKTIDPKDKPHRTE